MRNTGGVVEAELVAQAASTLVGLMVSDGWVQVKERLARFFARGGDEGSTVEELRLSREELMAAREADDEPAAEDIEAGWRTRLRRQLQADPAAAEELLLLLAELNPEAESERVGVVHNTISGGVQHGPVIQGQHFSGLTFHSAGALPPVPGAGAE